MIYTGWRTCRLRWNQPRGRYSAPGDRNYKVKSAPGLSLSFAPRLTAGGRDRSEPSRYLDVLSIRVAAFGLRQRAGAGTQEFSASPEWSRCRAVAAFLLNPLRLPLNYCGIAQEC